MDQGACALHNCPFVEIGVAGLQRFPALQSLAPGAQATVWVPWLTPASAAGQGLFATPALRVRIDPLPGKLSLGDNVALSEFGRVQAMADASADVTLRAPDFLYTPATPLTAFLNRISNVPGGQT